MKVLVACEYSGIVSAAFAAKGHDVLSCDLDPSERPGKHYQGDVIELLSAGSFDLMIAFPPCTFLAQCQMHRKSNHDIVNTLQAFNFILSLFYSKTRFIAIENPIGWLNTNWRAPDQILYANQFGSPYGKAFCL